MLDLKRGFRRLFLVLSVVWAGGSGFYLWRFAPPAVTETKGNPIVVWDEKGNPLLVDEKNNPIPSPPPGFVLELALEATIPTRQQVVDAIADLTTEQQLRILKLLEPTILAARALQEAPKPHATDSRLRSWLEIGLVPPMIAFALLESLLWAARGFLGGKAQ